MLRRLLSYCGYIAKRFVAEGGPLQAAGLSYVSLLSLVSLLTVSFSILAAFPIFKGIGNEIQQLILTNFIASSAQTVQHQLQLFLTQSTKLSVTSTIFLLLTSVFMIFSIEQAFNHIWKVKKRRHMVQAFMMYWAVLTLTPILIGIGFLASTYLMGFSLIHQAAAIPIIRRVILTVTPYVFTFLAFMLLYVAVPNCKVRPRDAAIGAVVATILFEIVKFFFSFYITHFPTYRIIYGALAAVPLFLLWLYLSWIVILLGALISYAIGHGATAEA